jgi:starch synthase
MLLLSPQIVSPSLTKFIESSGKPFVPKDEFAEAYTNFIKKRFYQNFISEYVQ